MTCNAGNEPPTPLFIYFGLLKLRAIACFVDIPTYSKCLSKGQFQIYPSNIYPDQLCVKSHVEKFEELHGGTTCMISLHPINYY